MAKIKEIWHSKGSTVGWCEIKLLLKSQNRQADYGSMSIPEQLLSKVFGHRMYNFLQNLPQLFNISTL